MNYLFISTCLLIVFIGNMNLFERNQRNAPCLNGSCSPRPPPAEYYPLPAPYEATSELPS